MSDLKTCQKFEDAMEVDYRWILIDIRDRMRSESLDLPYALIYIEHYLPHDHVLYRMSRRFIDNLKKK